MQNSQWAKFSDRYRISVSKDITLHNYSQHASSGCHYFFSSLKKKKNIIIVGIPTVHWELLGWTMGATVFVGWKLLKSAISYGST